MTLYEPYTVGLKGLESGLSFFLCWCLKHLCTNISNSFQNIPISTYIRQSLDYRLLKCLLFEEDVKSRCSILHGLHNLSQEGLALKYVDQ